MKEHLYKLTFLMLLGLALNSCTAINSTVNAVGRSISSVFKTPRKITDKITEPYRSDARLSVLWIGHATVLIQMDDKFILTDPVFTPTVGQVSKRLVEPGIDPVNLPQIDAVLISHMHIDHYSPASIEMIEKKIKQLLIPQGGFVYVPNFDIEMSEISTWQTWEKDGLRITAVPVIHNGWRYALDHAWMTTSYTGYVVEYQDMSVYIGGDTAYDSTLFKETGKKFTDIDLAILPIAPIHPREYSKARHTDPAEALQITMDLDADYLLPIHYDTFPESLDSLGEAGNLMREEIKRLRVDPDRVAILEIGEQRVLIYRREDEHLTSY